MLNKEDNIIPNEKKQVFLGLVFENKTQKYATLSNYEMYAKTNLLILTLGNFEAFFKTVYQEKYPTSAENRFKEIITKLVTDSSLNIDYLNLFNAYAYTRNTLHYSGLQTRNTATITYKTRTFDFTQNQLVAFDWDIAEFFLEETRIFLNEFINSSYMKAITNLSHPNPFL